MALTAILVPAATLAVAGVRHQRYADELLTAIEEHQILGPQVSIAVARVLGPAEFIAGVGVLVSVFFGLSIWAVLMMCGLYVGFSAYILATHVMRPGAPCGCDTGDTPANGVAVARTLVHTALSVLSIRGLAYLNATAPTTEDIVVGVLASSAITSLLWFLPASIQMGPGQDDVVTPSEGST